MLDRLPSLSLRGYRVAGIDIEAAPSAWAGSDFCYKRFLCASWATSRYGSGLYLPLGFTKRQLEVWVRALREPDILWVGHNITYDLDGVNGTLAKFGLPHLEEVLVSDTQRHLPRHGYFYSRRLGDMAKRFGCEHQKYEMDPYDWEMVAEGDPDAIAKLREYNLQDVRVTLELREKLLEAGLLGPPRIWTPTRRA